MMTAEQIVTAQKSNVETLFGLTGKAFEGVEKLVELNLQVAKAAMSEAPQTTQAALSVKDAQELLALQAEPAPAGRREGRRLRPPRVRDRRLHRRRSHQGRRSARAPTRKPSSCRSSTRAVKNAPAGTENAVALVKSAVAAANNAFESVQKATKQAAEVAEANFQAMTTTAVRATQARPSEPPPERSRCRSRGSRRRSEQSPDPSGLFSVPAGSLSASPAPGCCAASALAQLAEVRRSQRRRGRP